nr:MAG TPA: hypothetical protein [Caudoviricetes sp.]
MIIQLMITIVNTVILFITYNFYYIGTVYKNSQLSLCLLDTWLFCAKK